MEYAGGEGSSKMHLPFNRLIRISFHRIRQMSSIETFYQNRDTLSKSGDRSIKRKNFLFPKLIHE